MSSCTTLLSDTDSRQSAPDPLLQKYPSGACGVPESSSSAHLNGTSSVGGHFIGWTLSIPAVDPAH